MAPSVQVVAAAQEAAANLENWQVVAVALVGLLTYSAYRHHVTKIDLPSFGVPEGLFGSWRAAFTFVTQSEFFFREGYRKYGKQGKPFKIATPARYLVVFSDPEMIKELAQTDEHIISFKAASQERIATPYTFSRDFAGTNHNDIIQRNLTNRLSNILPEVMGELVLAFEEKTKIGSEWTSVNNYDVMIECISQTTNRLLVGLPFCRDKDYLKHCVQFASAVSSAATLIDLFPNILKPIVARIVFSARDKAVAKTVAVIGPIFEERRRKLCELGDAWTDKPNDAIQWIADASSADVTIENMCLSILLLNFTAIHTTSFAIMHVMHDLAASPEYQEPLRAEIESVVGKFGGWTKQALTAMKKLDSVLRESQRLNGIALVAGMRKSLVPHTFSDGTFVPKGTWVAAPAAAVHRDVDVYENAAEFDGFRFARIREQPGQEAKHQMVSVTSDYLAFGMGNHACPGRFFATNELKLLLGYIILNYEFKAEIDGQRPANTCFVYARVPDMSAKLMYRERKDRKQSFANSLIPVARV